MTGLFLAFLFLAADPPKQDVPKVALIGDSIRMGYAPKVTEKLQGKVTILSVKENGADTANVLKNLDAWLAEKPKLVIFNCGLHDLKYKDGKHQVPPDAYEKNLKEIVAKVRATGAKVVFATSTPINDEKHKNRKAAFERTEKYVIAYNEIATKVMKAANVPILDLHTVVVKGGQDKLQNKDGTHYTPEGYVVLAAAVVESINKELKPPTAP